MKGSGWAVVTGGSSGIGRGFAWEVARRGMSLVLVARGREALEELAEQIRQRHGVAVDIVVADLGLPEGVQAVLEVIRSREIELFVASAGFGTSGPFVELDVDEELRMVQVNCHAVVELTHAVAQKMKRRGRGGIILLGSLLGWQGVPLSATYAATKAFVQSLAEGLHEELRPYRVDVLSVAPGPVLSNFDRRANMTIRQGATPEQVAAESMRALGKRTTVVPGPLSKLLTYSLFTAPRALRVRILQRVMAGLTNHGKA